jgi:hypothetical protein
MKAVLVILCLVITGCDQLKAITSSAKYQLVSDNNGHVWKIDTTTGEVWMCAFEGGGLITCNHAVQI